MLDPPITQKDVHEGTVFLCEDGSTDTIIRGRSNSKWPWTSNRGNYYTHAGVRYTGIFPEHNFISRLPKGEKMESQITLKDERKTVSEWVDFDDLPSSCLFICEGSPAHVHAKLVSSDGSLAICPNRTLVIVKHGGGNFTRCKIVPDIRLDLILRNA